MRDRDKNTALHFGIMDKCKKLEKELLQIDGITDVEFDLDGFWSGIYQVIVLTKYDIPVSHRRTRKPGSCSLRKENNRGKKSEKNPCR